MLLRAVPFTLIYVPLALVVVGLALGGVWTFLPLMFVFGMVPLLDVLLGKLQWNPTEDERKVLDRHWAFRLVMHTYVPVQVALVITGAWAVTHLPLTLLEQTGLTLSVGLCTGAIGITLAHELIHKANATDRWLGRILLACASYMHFYIEHLIGHHGRVATPEDPATSRFGESFYRYYPRTVLGSFRSAWDLEAQRLERLQVPFFHWRNQMIWFTGIPVAIATLLGLSFGWQAALFFAVQSVFAFSLLEVINYIEHYGLERPQLDNGRYAKVTVMHSWSASERLTNWFLFNLQRHSDHHANAMKPYQCLLHLAESPQLPTGYAGMVLLALIPPLWRQVMDPRVEALKSHHA